MSFKIFLNLCLLAFLSCSTRHGVHVISSTHNINKIIDHDSVLRGKTLYQQHCLSCHGTDGAGNGPDAGMQLPRPANLRKLANRGTDFKFFMDISEWQGGMPGWRKHYSSEQREDLAAYIKSFK